MNPSNFYQLFLKKFDIIGENHFYHFYFEKPNLIYYGIRDNDSTKIKIIFLDSEDEINFTWIK